VRYLAKPFDPGHLVDVVADLLAPGALPEPVLRRRVQTTALERLARLESGDTSVFDHPSGARVHLTRLDRPRVGEEPVEAVDLDAFLASLPGRQREVAERVAMGERVVDIATDLGVSRSNLYAVLRRVARRAGLPDGRAAIHLLRRLGGLRAE